MFNKYWFKKTEKKAVLPSTWEGYALFCLVIMFAVGAQNFKNILVDIAIIIGAFFAYTKAMKLKTDPINLFDKKKDYRGIWGIFVAFGIFLSVAIIAGLILHALKG